jgi:phage gpG-like protein
MGVFSLLEFAAKLEVFDHDLKAAEPKIIAAACAMVADRARGMIGTQQAGWAPLKPETIARKATGDSPLLETGEMRDSITWNSDATEGYVGTNNQKAIWQTYGTSRGIPPRPFIEPAAVQKEAEIDKMAYDVVAAVFGGSGSGVMGEIFKVLRETGHSLKKTAEGLYEMVQDDGNNDR